MRRGRGRGGRARRVVPVLLAVACCGPAGLALLALLGCGSAAPPNVLLISIDTLRPDHLGAYGYERDTSPSLDGLARDGVLWENAYAPSPATVASHATLFTGRYPYQHRTLNYATALPDAERTLAEILAEAGYRTFAVATSVRFHPGSGFPQGFETYQTLHELDKNARSRAATDRVLELAAAADGRPFFGFVHYFGPHGPYWPPEPYRSRWQTGPAPELPGGPSGFLKGHKEPGHSVPPRTLRYLRALYDAEILYLDRDLSRLLAGLDEQGLARGTLVVVVSDHGEEFEEHDGLGHARTLYEESLRVPLLMRWPDGLPAGRRVAWPAQLVDVVPTVLDLVGEPLPPGLPGRSLAVDLRSGGHAPGFGRVLGQRGTHQWSVAASLPEGRFKLLFEQGRRPRLFELGSDPGEQRDLAATRSPILERLVAMTPAPLVEGPESAPTAEVPAEVIERLGEIGYADELGREPEAALFRGPEEAP